MFRSPRAGALDGNLPDGLCHDIQLSIPDQALREACHPPVCKRRSSAVSVLAGSSTAAIVDAGGAALR
jgi:hypothetical protein